ncbi:MAG: dTMP kinase [Candidatus Krumholzibacteria bacterium]|nr:dTMP kinase [Candidatus Krumholzibacteria bacterium]
MRTPPPRFIVLEGLDGAGTTTQAGRLHHWLTSRGAASFATREPTTGPVGALIRELLAGPSDPTAGGDPPPAGHGERAMALLFAADRAAHSVEIARRLAAGAHVICDRYVFSSLAYQTLDAAITPEWVAEANSGCAVPDITFLLEVPATLCLERIAARNDGRTIYERRDLLEAIAEGYARLRAFYAERFGELVTIDGTRSPEDVQTAIRDTLRDRFDIR